MSVIPPHTAASGARHLSQSQEMLGRSLSRLSSGAKTAGAVPDSAAPGVSIKTHATVHRLSVASAGLQGSLAQVQTAEAFLQSMDQALSRMAELVTPGGNAAAHAADRARPHEEFRALQDQLRATIGGAAAEIGGAADLNAPRGTFQGTPLFGPGPAARPGTSGDADERLALPEINLRSGAMLSLIRQEESGAYRVHPDDAGIASLLSTAAQEVATAHASTGAARDRLTLAAMTLRVEGENRSAALPGIRNLDAARESTRLARYDIQAPGGAALAAHANHSPQSVLKLLQN